MGGRSSHYTSVVQITIVGLSDHYAFHRHGVVHWSLKSLVMMKPERYPQQDFFFADILDAAPKSDMASLEHPLFALSKRPSPDKWEYRNGDTFVRVNPKDGMPTILDKDILIYCVSQLREGMNRGKDVSNRIEFHPYDLFRATNRPMDGKSYQWLRMAMKRLMGTSVETNVTTGTKEEYDEFNILQHAGYKRDSRDGMRDSAHVQLSDWLYRAVESKEVLTLSRDYFRIRSALQRRLYEIGRKHCGKQRSWVIGMEKLYAKSGSRSTIKSFRYALQKAIVSDDAIPDYVMDYDKVKDQVVFTNKKHGPSMLVRAMR